MRRRSLIRVAAPVLAALVTLTACLSDGGGGGGNAGADAGGDKKVEIFGAFPGAEADAFRASLKDFEAQSGIQVTYVPSTNFTELIRSRVAGNNAPDIAIFPQPGLLTDLANTGKLDALDDVLDLSSLQKSLVSGILDSTKGEDGKTYGAPIRLAVKSIVWYPNPEFGQAGYTVPKTETELLALTDKIRSEGKTPWCIGMEAGQATGWVATDWIEEFVLRIGGPEKYDQWVKHEIPFNDPVVKQAAEEFQKIAFPDGNVLGGRSAIVSTPFGTSANPMFQSPPQCWLHRQGNFITSGGFFPADVTKDLSANVGIFALPPVEGGTPGKPVVGGGDLAAIFNKDNADAVEVLKFITSDKFGAQWAKTGGWLSPHKTFDATNYPDDITKAIAKEAADATVFRFDGSDLMPGAVGSGSFWKGMVAWISGQKDLDTVLSDIDKSWPK